MVTFFFIITVTYTYANTFGISLTFLGVITFYQMMQFFQNFKYLHHYYTGVLMATKSRLKMTQNYYDPYSSNIEEHHHDSNMTHLIKFCQYYGKYSSGVGLFISKIMCFTILVDSFNMNIVDHINLIDPYYLMAIVFGCSGLMFLASLDLMSVDRFV